METKKVLAVDLGGSSGRVVLGELADGQIKTTELHRFSNDPVTINGTLYWDILRIFHEIKIGLLKSKPFGKIDSIGIDTWGVDFGLLDSTGNMLDNPVHYRDERNVGMLDKAFKLIDAKKLYSLTGNQLMEINTAFQLLAVKEKRPELLSMANTLLPTPNLLSYFLGGKAVAEETIASTTQLFDHETRNWSKEAIAALGLPEDIFPEIVKGGTRLGTLSASICEELGIEPCEIIAVCGHDTQSAQMAVPAKEKDFLFISCGTWSLVGTENDTPILSEKAYELDLTNEAAYDGKTSFMKNIIGLWLIQESRRQWAKEGYEYSFGELEELAAKEEAFKCFIDPDAPEFVAPGNIPERIREYCRKTNQPVPETIGQVVRCIDESLAMKYKKVKAEIENCTGKSYDNINIVGGGAQSKLLCQLTADICQVKVTAGPVEATVLGNIATQFLANGTYNNLAEIRENMQGLSEIKVYEAKAVDGLLEKYEEYLKIIDTKN